MGDKVLIIGAAGAIGKQLCRALLGRGTEVVACLLDRRFPLPEDIAQHPKVTCEWGVDVTKEDAVVGAFRKHAGQVGCVWNLAAPLSVETAQNPERAHAVVVAGMHHVLNGMDAAGVSKICFTDSIGSYGDTAPRRATARWLTQNPHQEPGSDYGRQKRWVREILRDYNGDTRWAVLPGVLHEEAQWGRGTTEYALEAMQAAHRGEVFGSPLDEDLKLPMIFATDLIRGLVALQDAPREALQEPESGYALSGFSFTADELYEEVRKHIPAFKTTPARNENVQKFARLWPDELAPEEAERDLGFRARVGLKYTVKRVLAAHDARMRLGHAVHVSQ